MHRPVRVARSFGRKALPELAIEGGVAEVSEIAETSIWQLLVKNRVAVEKEPEDNSLRTRIWIETPQK